MIAPRDFLGDAPFGQVARVSRVPALGQDAPFVESDLERKLCGMVAFQCALITLRGVSAQASEEMLWQTLASALVEQYRFEQVAYDSRLEGDWVPVVRIPACNGDSAWPGLGECFAHFDVVVEGILEGRLNLSSRADCTANEFQDVQWHQQRLDIDCEEQIKILLSEASTMLSERRFRERSMEALRRANLQAEAASTAKSRLLANVSHELRTPLNGILGMTDLVLEGPLETEQKQHLETVKVCAESLLRILGDILDYSKLEAGKQELMKRNFDARGCVGDVVSLMAGEARKKGLRLELEVAESTPSELWGDDSRLRQVLMNLLGNAVKFTQQGRVVVRVWPESGGAELAGSEQGWIHFLVGDSGPGVLSDKQKLIFAPFEQGDAAMNRRHGGTGLGLAISKQLVDLMGGRIWIESPWRDSLGGALIDGSAFHFTIPSQSRRVVEEKQKRSPQRLEASRSLRILLAEDNALNRHLALRVLEKMGHTVLIAEDGRQALDLVFREQLDLVLMDVQMPEMDGIEATRAIRKSEGNGRHLPIVALTAHAMLADRENCLAAGMNDYLTKPIRREELFRVIEAVAGSLVAGAA